MRLIDADALKKDLKSVTLSNGTLVNTNAVLYLLEEYPTAYDPDKIVEQLEEVEKIMTSPVNKDCFGEECRASDCTVCLISKAIEIVKGGGVDG
jgi:hypothetical protein